MKKNNKGFSLIEIVVVLAIMGVIAAFLTPMLFNYLSDSKIKRAQNDVGQIASAIGRFNIDTGVFPVYASLPLNNANATLTVLYTNGNDATNAGSYISTGVTACPLQKPLEVGVTKADTLYNASSGVQKPQEWKGPYMSDFKADPWGNKYYVVVDGLRPQAANVQASFVISAGPDGTIDTVYTQGSSTGGTSTAFAIANDDIVFRIK